MKLNELNNYAQLRADYIAVFDSYANADVESLTRNDLAQLLGVSYGSIKVKQLTYRTNADMLSGRRSANINTSTLTPEAKLTLIAELQAQLAADA